MKILTVDDSSVVRKIIRGAAEVLDFELVEAEDGIEAMQTLDKMIGQIDLVLLDWNMPGLNGLEVLKQMKEHPSHKNIPVMMVTTESHKDNIVQAIKAGASHYMVKPFTMDELTKRILECLGRGYLV